jgi:Rrf2 family protein
VRLSSQEEYGLRCLLQIAREPEGFSTITAIAGREALTPAYVAKLMRILRKGGLVQSIRGQKGGYQLSRPADEIRVGMVLRVLGGPLYARDFCERHAGNQRVCVHDVDCAIRTVWSALENVVQRALGETSLKDLLRPERGMESWVQTNVVASPALLRRV